MLKPLFFIGVSLGAIGLSVPAFAHGENVRTELSSADAAADGGKEGAAPIPTMSFGTWGVDTTQISKTIKPGDDFFGFVNQKWLDANPLPPQFSRFGAFNLLREKSTSDVKALVDELVAKTGALTTDEQRIVDSYSAFLNTDAIEKAGLDPARDSLTTIATAQDLNALAELWAKPGMPSPINGFVSVDAKEPSRYSAYLIASGLGLPVRDYYLDQSEKGKAIQAKYQAYIAFLLKEAGYADPDAMASKIYAFEDTIARTISWSRVAQRNDDLTYRAVTPADLDAKTTGFPVAAMLNAMGLGATDRYIVYDVQPTAEEAAKLGISAEEMKNIGTGTYGMAGLLAATPLDVLKAWTTKEFLSAHSSVLPARFDEANFDLFGRMLRGQPVQREREKRGIDEVESQLGELLGKSYVARYFPPANKKAMQELVANLGSALGDSIRALPWMGKATQKEALAKLKSFDPKIGYRDNLETYASLEVRGDNPLANRMASAAWEHHDNVSKLGQPIDRTEWGMLPQTVNAYYNPTKNEIVFPAGILQQPFFALTNDAAVNYGGIGGVIGHEMGHGFDDQGSKSDGTGALRDWWQPADRAAFDKLGAKLTEQYNAYCPLDEGKTCVNGKLTLGENIGDLGGLSLAYRAYKKSLKGKKDKVIDGLTGDQRFFIAWAQVWRSKERAENTAQRLRTDPHSPEQYRTNGIVRNMDAWYKAFNVKPGDALYLPPAKRVKIW